MTTVYPTTATGAHGNSGDKTAGKDVFPSEKGRKRLKSSGNRYSGIVWEHAGGAPAMTIISGYMVALKPVINATFPPLL